MYSVWSVGRKKQKPTSDFPFPYHTKIEVDITTLTNRGIGLGRVPLPIDPSAAATSPAPESEGGWVVMVPFCLTGERVRARIFRNQKNFSEADLVEVLTASPDRIEPPCPLFGRYGGCQYQHFSYAAQLVWKRQQVEDLLEHMAGLTHSVNPVIGSPAQYVYRSKITPHFQLPKEPRDQPLVAELPIGFLRQGTRFDIVDVPTMPHRDRPHQQPPHRRPR